MPIRHKGLLIILDGLGDRPSAILGGATPLEAAHTAYLERFFTLRNRTTGNQNERSPRPA